MHRKDTNRKMDVVTQRCVGSEDPTVNMECRIIDRMLRHDWLDTHFFMDEFFATKKSVKSTRDNKCCQLFVTDKSFVHVETLRKRSYLICALKVFHERRLSY